MPHSHLTATTKSKRLIMRLVYLKLLNYFLIYYYNNQRRAPLDIIGAKIIDKITRRVASTAAGGEKPSPVS